MGVSPETRLVSGLHFGAAVVFLLAGGAGLLWVSPDLAAGRYLAPRVAGVTHLFTLGWLTTTIFGALYQLLPVALGTPIRWARLGYASLVTFVPGVALFAVGVAFGATPLHHAGIALVATGILLTAANVGASLHRATQRDVTWWAIAAAIVALVSTLLLGVVLLHNVHTGFLAGARLSVLSIHLHVALVGWVLTMIVGIAQRLLPMFLLSHGVDARWARWALVLLVSGLTALVGGLALAHGALTWAGGALLAGGVVAFLVQARLFFAARVRRRVDAGMRFAATGLAFLAAAAALGLTTLALGPAAPRVAAAYGIAGLLGGVVLFVVGHFYKIVPFLAWIAQYHGRMGRERVPAVADLYSARAATVQWGLMTAGCIALTAGTLAGHPHCTRAGAAMFAAGTVILATQMTLLRRNR